MTNAELRDHLLGTLAPIGVCVRPMFGGYGLYLADGFFGIIAEGHAWFRTDSASRIEFLERGMPAFQPARRPRGPRTVDRNFQVPDEIVADPDLLLEWALRAAGAVRE